MKCEKCGCESESLALLADRKGFKGVVYDRTNDGAVGPKMYYCTPFKTHPDGGDESFEAPTYADCEAKARAWLNGQKDKK